MSTSVFLQIVVHLHLHHIDLMDQKLIFLHMCKFDTWRRDDYRHFFFFFLAFYNYLLLLANILLIQNNPNHNGAVFQASYFSDSSLCLQWRPDMMLPCCAVVMLYVTASPACSSIH